MDLVDLRQHAVRPGGAFYAAEDRAGVRIDGDGGPVGQGHALRHIAPGQDFDGAHVRGRRLPLDGGDQRSLRHRRGGGVGYVPPRRMQPMVDIAFEGDDAAGQTEHGEEESGCQAEAKVNLQQQFSRRHHSVSFSRNRDHMRL